MLCSCVHRCHCVSVSVCESGHPSRPSAWLGCAGAAGVILSRPLWSFISCPSLLLLSCSLGSRLVLRRPGSVGRLPHSLCPCWPQLQGLQGSATAQEPRDGGRRGGPSLRMGGVEQGKDSPPLPLTVFSRPPIGSRLLVSMVMALDWWAGPAGRVGTEGRASSSRDPSPVLPPPPTCSLPPFVPTCPRTFLVQRGGGQQTVLPTSTPARDQ